MDRDDEDYGRPVPAGRLARAARMGALAGGIGGRALAGGLARLATGRRPRAAELLLTPAHAARIAGQLAGMRGAAMKLGQLVSMDAGEFLPPELTAILARLREGAEPMPPRQLRAQLDRAWGQGWLRHFASFAPRPMAAASIGQVHRAQTKDGRDLAIKVQYPGVAASIDSDIRNLGLLLRMPGLLPEGIDLPPLLEEARAQLRAEADYLREADQMRAYAGLLAGRSEFALPAPVPEFCTPEVLAMTYVPGDPIETLEAQPQDVRDRVAHDLARLVLDELFAFNLMQTDPNFANYRWQAATGRIVLLDFGATRSFTAALGPRFRRLLAAAHSGERAAIRAAAIEIGYFREETAPAHQNALLEMMEMAFAPLRQPGLFDLAGTDIPHRISDLAMQMARTRSRAEMPPPEVLFLHRKFGGLYLLLARLRARVDLAELVRPYQTS